MLANKDICFLFMQSLDYLISDKKTAERSGTSQKVFCPCCNVRFLPTGEVFCLFAHITIPCYTLCNVSIQNRSANDEPATRNESHNRHGPHTRRTSGAGSAPAAQRQLWFACQRHSTRSRPSQDAVPA